jgi:hypothetical protein
MKEHEKEYWIKQLEEIFKKVHDDGYYFRIKAIYDDRTIDMIYSDYPQLLIEIGEK